MALDNAGLVRAIKAELSHRRFENAAALARTYGAERVDLYWALDPRREPVPWSDEKLKAFKEVRDNLDRVALLAEEMGWMLDRAEFNPATVQAAAAPAPTAEDRQVVVHVHPVINLQQPAVTVNVPEQPAPIVHMHPQIGPVTVQEPPPGDVVIERDRNGEITGIKRKSNAPVRSVAERPLATPVTAEDRLAHAVGLTGAGE